MKAVLSGNRNFEGLNRPDVKMNYLASPPLVIVYALAGTMDIDLASEPIGQGADGRDVFMADVWPTTEEIEAVVAESISADMFASRYADVFAGDARWQNLPTPSGELFAWDEAVSYTHLDVYKRQVVTRRHRGEAVGLLDARRLQHLAVEADTLDGAPAVRRAEPAEGVRIDVDHRDGVAAPRQARRQRRAHALSLIHI